MNLTHYSRAAGSAARRGGALIASLLVVVALEAGAEGPLASGAPTPE